MASDNITHKWTTDAMEATYAGTSDKLAWLK